MENTEALLTMDGLSVKVELRATDDGPLLYLEGAEGVALEGIAPGEYLLVEHVAA